MWRMKNRMRRAEDGGRNMEDEKQDAEGGRQNTGHGGPEVNEVLRLG